MSSTFNSKTQERNWLELPSDVTANILKRIGTVDILENAENVCTAWRKICTTDPTLWKVIDMRDFQRISSLVAWIPTATRCKRLVDRSQGQLVDITIVNVYNDKLLLYVAQRSSELRRLVISRGYQSICRSLTGNLMKFPNLEELGLYYVKVSKEVIEFVGRFCPGLKTLKVHQEACRKRLRDTDERSITSYNEIAIAIGQNLLELRHLELIGNNMTNIGLEGILDGCCHLKTLDVSRCFNIDLKGDLGKRCSKQIEVLKMSRDSLKLYEEDDDAPYDNAYPDIPETYDGYISQ